MSTRQFQDVPNVVEVQCSGSSLGPNVELFSLTLYAIEDDEVLASVSLNKLECATSSSFSACFVDRLNPFNTTLHTLVVDLHPGQRRLYGCNVSMNTAGRPAIIHWAIAASLRAEYGDPSESGFRVCCLGFGLVEFGWVFLRMGWLSGWCISDGLVEKMDV